MYHLYHERCSSLIYGHNPLHDICDLTPQLHRRHHGTDQVKIFSQITSTIAPNFKKSFLCDEFIHSFNLHLHDVKRTSNWQSIFNTLILFNSRLTRCYKKYQQDYLVTTAGTGGDYTTQKVGSNLVKSFGSYWHPTAPGQWEAAVFILHR